jgi:hypothetical protein
VFDTLRKMKTMRQIEAAELLVNANNYSVAYVNAILAGTPQAQLVEASKPKKVKGITPEAMARMERNWPGCRRASPLSRTPTARITCI